LNLAGAVPTDLIESDKNGKQFTQMINGVENVAPLISYTTLSAQETLDVYAEILMALMHSSTCLKR
jgi:hypothetical protein